MGVYLRFWRELYGVTLEELSDKTGYPVGTLSLCERGKRNVPIPILEAIARVLGREPSDLLKDPRPHLVVKFPPKPPSPTHSGSKTVN